MLCFAYGSNMDPAQIQQRCPGAQKVGVGVLRGYGLCFPRLSHTRGCGVASIEPVAEQEVWGVVYQLTAAALAALDHFEGYRADGRAEDNRYNRVAIAVEIDGVATDVETYIAVSQENPPPPNAHYLQQLRDGARHHGLPEAYRAFLAGLA
jgi:gamma-glutamylcyclotransferase (GGCT)/AIG2-like uncharacterized protein YtfP